MGDIPPNLQVIATALITALVTWYSTRSGNSLKAQEMKKDSQSEFLSKVLARLDKVQEAYEELCKEMAALRSELHTLKAEARVAELNNTEQLRVLSRVAGCTLVGCPHAARAAEFGGET